MWTLSDTLFFSVVIILLGGLLIGAYWIGRTLERNAYTKVFMKQVEAAYWDGYNDRNKECVDEFDKVYQSGKKDGYKQCLNEDYKQHEGY